MESIVVTIDGRDIKAKRGSSILECALAGGIYVPHLCHHQDLPSIGACRLCLVEAAGSGGLSASWTVQAANGTRIITKLDQIDRLGRFALELMPAGYDEIEQGGAEGVLI